MTLFPKLRYAKQAVVSIATHDDEAAEDRLKILAELKAFIDAEIEKAVAREKAKLTPPPTEEIEPSA